MNYALFSISNGCFIQIIMRISAVLPVMFPGSLWYTDSSGCQMKLKKITFWDLSTTMIQNRITNTIPHSYSMKPYQWELYKFLSKGGWFTYWQLMSLDLEENKWNTYGFSLVYKKYMVSDLYTGNRPIWFLTCIPKMFIWLRPPYRIYRFYPIYPRFNKKSNICGIITL